MLMQAKVKTARRPIQHTVERPALLKIRLRSGADFLTQRNDLNRRGRRASMHGFTETAYFIAYCGTLVRQQVLFVRAQP